MTAARYEPDPPRIGHQPIDPSDLWNLVPDALIVVEPSGRILAVNEAALSLFGYTAADLVGRTIECLIDPGLRSLHVAHRRRFNEQPNARPMSNRAVLAARRSDGSPLKLSIALAPLEIGSQELTIAAARDVTNLSDAAAAIAEMHDSSVQRLFGIAMTLQALARSDDVEHLQDRLVWLANEIGSVIEEIRSNQLTSGDEHPWIHDSRLGHAGAASW